MASAFPGGLDLNGAAEQGAIAGLQLGVHRVVDDDWPRHVGGLAGVPVLDGDGHAGLERGVELVVLGSPLELSLPLRLAKAQLSPQRFGKAMRSIFIPSCSQLLERMGSRAMISEPAATRMATIATEVGSMLGIKRSFQVSPDRSQWLRACEG